MSDTGWSGDPFHEGTSKPLESLRGSMENAPTQEPKESEAQTNPRSTAPENIQQTWNTTSLAPTAPNTPNNDKVEAH